MCCKSSSEALTLRFKIKIRNIDTGNNNMWDKICGYINQNGMDDNLKSRPSHIKSPGMFVLVLGRPHSKTFSHQDKTCNSLASLHNFLSISPSIHGALALLAEHCDSSFAGKEPSSNFVTRFWVPLTGATPCVGIIFIDVRQLFATGSS